MSEFTREAWLSNAITKLRPLFDERELEIPAVRVSCGLAAHRLGGSTIGECWSDECSADGTREIFISPQLVDPIEVLETLVHEAVHSCLPHEIAHGREFKKAIEKVGLEGKATATHAGAWLKLDLFRISDELGEYPHAALSTISKTKQPTRMVKVECHACGYIVRTTEKWIVQGVPTCPCGTEMVKA